MSGVNFTSFLDGVRLAENDIQTQRDRESRRAESAYALDRRQTLDQRNDAEYSNTQLDKEAERTSAEQFAQLTNTVGMTARERGVDPTVVWLEAYKNANISGSTPTSSLLFDRLLDKHAKMSQRDAINRGDFVTAKAISSGRGLPAYENTSALKALADPAEMAAQLGAQGFPLAADGRVLVGGQWMSPVQAYTHVVSTGGGGALAAVAAMTQADKQAAINADQTQKLGAVAQEGAALRADNLKQAWGNVLTNSTLNVPLANLPEAINAMPDNYFTGAGTTKADYLRFKLAASAMPPPQQQPNMPTAATGSSGLQGYQAQFPSAMPAPAAPAAVPMGAATQASQNKWASKSEAAQKLNAWAKGLVK
jgi:hypothetical protein